MKKVISLILTLLMLMSVAVIGVSAAGGNLLYGGDFNSGALKNWWMRADWNGGTWSYASGEGNEGTGALKVTGVGAGNPDQNAGLFYTEQEGQEYGFKPMADEQYQVSFMVNYPADVSADVYVDINEGALGSGHATGAGGWEKVSFNFTAPSDEKIKVRLVVNSLGDGETVIIDDFYITSLSGNHEAEAGSTSEGGGKGVLDSETELLGDNLLENGSFEKAMTSKWWFRVDWNGGYWMRMDGVGKDGFCRRRSNRRRLRSSFRKCRHLLYRSGRSRSLS